LFRGTFSPAFSAYTFPFVISAIAAKSSVIWLKAQGIEHVLFATFQHAAFWIATVFTITALVRYLVFLFVPKPNKITAAFCEGSGYFYNSLYCLKQG
jgi:tellurite resistance protein TehA-like permease